MKPSLAIKRVRLTENGCAYETFRLVGTVDGQRIRKQFQNREDALGEKNRLEVVAANARNRIRITNTRLSEDQVAEAEAAFHRLGGKTLTEVVDWFLTNYRPPCVEKPLGEAVAAFLEGHSEAVVKRHHDEVRRQLYRLRDHLSALRAVHTITVEDATRFLTAQGWGPKTWNNVRGTLSAFFGFCMHTSRRWTEQNPVSDIGQREVRRGLPEIVSAEKLAQVLHFLEGYTGGARNLQPAGFLIPYFCLAAFAGLRPSARDGEIVKLARHPALQRLLNLELGVIQILPEISKTNDLRQVLIRPNLRAWLEKYPVSKYPIEVPGLEGHATDVRRRFGLSGDVLRHSFISAHVAKWKSRGEAALEAGNSESIVKKHYFNLVSESEADRFWSVLPSTVR